MIASARTSPATLRARRLAALLTGLLAALLLVDAPANAQDWGDDSNDDWSAPQPAETPAPSRSGSSAYRPAPPGWSIQTGIGFTADPDTFLVNLDAPYAFNDWIAFGPAMQIGVTDTRTVVSPTGHLRVTIPDLPGRAFDRVHPYGIAGMGFTVIENDNGRRDGDAAVGFLIDFGVGVEYQVSEKVFLGTQMMFNFLPEKVKREEFYFAWQVAGIRFDF
jgi:hypothetical protein